MIIDRSNFASSAGWTVTTTVGAVTFNAPANTCVVTPGNAGFDKTGIMRTTSITPAAGQTYQINMNPSTNAGSQDYALGITDNVALTFGSGNLYYAYTDSGSPTTYGYDSGTSGSGLYTPTAASYKLLLFKLIANLPDPLVEHYYNNVLQKTSSNFGSAPYGDLNFQVNVDQLNGSSGALSLQEYVVTDDGTYTPPTPTSLSAVTISPTQINLTWTDSPVTAVNADSITVNRDSGAGFAPVGNVAIGQQFYHDTTVTPGNNYSYKINAKVVVNGVTYNGSDSNVATATTILGSDGSAMIALCEV